MLKFFKRMERTRNVVLIVFSVLLVVSLIVFGALQPDTGDNLLRSTETAATVGSETITLGELATQQQNSQQQQRFALPASMLLDGLIRQRMVKIEARNLGLTGSDAEVAERIRQIFKPEDGQPFDQAGYEQSAIRQAGSISAFEESIRDQISFEKLSAFITAGVSVSDAEVLENYRRRNTKFDLTYVALATADVAQKIEPSEEELAKYFEANKQNYYIDLPQKKIRYIFLETSKVGEKLDIPDSVLKATYDKLPEETRLAGVNVQEIVIRSAKPEFESEALDKATRIVTSLKQGQQTVTEERFADVAKGQSENPNTARNGGRVNGLVRRNPNNPDDPYQRVISMKEGEVTDPIKFGTSYYVLRRGKSVPKSFEEMKKELDVSERNRRAYTANAELAEKVVKRLKEAKDVNKVAAEFSGEANMSVGDMVRETGYVKPGDEIENLGRSQDFEQGIAPLEKANDVGEKIPVPNGFAVPILVDRKEPRDAELSEVRQSVEEAYKVEEARKRIESIAKRIASGASDAAGLSGAASGAGYEAKDADDFILGTSLGEGPSATTSEALETAVYDLKVGAVTEAIRVGDSWYVVGVKDREEASSEQFADQRDSLVQQMLIERRGRVFADYLAAVRRRMEQAGEIKIYQDVVSKLDEFNQQQTPQIPGLPPQGMPIPPQQSAPVPPLPEGE